MDPVCKGSFDNQQGGWLSPKTIRQEGVRSAITGGNPIRQKKCGRLSQEEIPFGKKTCGRLYGRRSRFGRGDTWQQEKSEAISFKIRCISFQILPYNRNLLGFVFRPGYKYTPPAIVKKVSTINQYKPAPVPPFESFSRVVEFFKRSHRSVDLCKYRQPCNHV